MNKRLFLGLEILLCVAALVVFLVDTDFFALRHADDPVQIAHLIGVSHANLTETWRLQMMAEIEESASAIDDLRVVSTDAAHDPARQVEDIRTLLSYGIDLLIVSPCDSDIVRATIEDVHAQIPAIIVDRGLQSSAFSMFIGPDNHAIGRMAGTAILAHLGRDGGNVLEITGPADSSAAMNRSQGLSGALSAQDNVQIVAQIEANWMQDQAEDQFKVFWANNQMPIDIIFAHNDAMATGASLALETLQAKAVPIFGLDALAGKRGGALLSANGTPAATIGCGTGGKEALCYGVRMLEGEPDIPRYLQMAPFLISVPEEQGI